MKALVKKFLLYYNTLRYLRFIQILWRYWFGIKRLFYDGFFPIINFLYERETPNAESIKLRGVRFLKGLNSIHKDFFRQNEVDEVLNSARRTLRNEFAFLNRKVKFHQGIGWNDQDLSHLGRYNLHYFDYLWDLGIADLFEGDEKYYLKFKEMVQSWIRDNRIGQLDGWHPYTISLRIVNWIYAYHFFEGRFEKDKDFRGLFLRNLYKQTLFLSLNLEYQHYGNHLLKNAKALTFAGMFFAGKGPHRWLRKGLSLLWDELDEQVLEDGGHFERSTMYHLIVLKDFLECLIVLKDNGFEVPEKAEHKVREMSHFLSQILHPDENIPLLNDSSLEIADSPEELLAIAAAFFNELEYKRERSEFGVLPYLLLGREGKKVFDEMQPSNRKPGSAAFKETGYFVTRDRGNEKYLVIDCGRVCPDYLPPHAHSDTLSYELSLGEERIIVDSGVYEYTSGKWRDFFRSTRAHNTVVIDGEEQSEVWGSFRVARRAFPKDVQWICAGRIIYFSGRHTGYRRLKGKVEHRRRLFFIDEAFWLVCDEIEGQSIHVAESFVHLHPDVSMRWKEDSSKSEHGIAVVKGNLYVLSILPFGYEEATTYWGEKDEIQGWYSLEFGLKVPNKVICFRKKGGVPFSMGYLLVPWEVNHFQVDRWWDQGNEWFRVELDDAEYEIGIGHGHGGSLSLHVESGSLGGNSL